jgi:hypothetical protein
MKSVALLVVAGVALAGCGGGSMRPATTGDTAGAQALIKSAYQKFFSGQTSVADREAVLEDGAKFKSVIQAFASNPLAKNVTVKVTSVKLQGQDKAKVVYVVKLGSVGLPQLTGTAVRQNGTWKVGDASLCKLVGLQGSTPSVCKS